MSGWIKNDMIEETKKENVMEKAKTKEVRFLFGSGAEIAYGLPTGGGFCTGYFPSRICEKNPRKWERL